MDILTLCYFASVCQNKSIAKAADSFFISRQALSKSIINLEKELGVQLLIRSHSGIELTPAGRRLQESAGEILQIWEATKRIWRRFAAKTVRPSGSDMARSPSPYGSPTMSASFRCCIRISTSAPRLLCPTSCTPLFWRTGWI